MMMMMMMMTTTIMAVIWAETAGYDFHRQVKFKPQKSNEV